MEDLIVAARKKYPRWGPRKLHAMLVERNPGLYVPSASVMAKVLKKRGMTAPRKRRRIKASLGIEIEIIAPGKPQQNGRLERLHRTLKDDTTKPPAAELAAQQRVFDRWRGEYNHFRPHEALRMRCPADVYKRSSRAYPRPLIQPSFEPYEHVLRLDRNGFAKWKNRNVLISSALQYEHVGIEHDFEKDGRWNVYWGAIRLGYLDEHSLKRGLIFPRRPRSVREVTRMAFVEL